MVINLSFIFPYSLRVEYHFSSLLSYIFQVEIEPHTLAFKIGPCSIKLVSRQLNLAKWNYDGSSLKLIFMVKSFNVQVQVMKF